MILVLSDESDEHARTLLPLLAERGGARSSFTCPPFRSALSSRCTQGARSRRRDNRAGPRSGAARRDRGDLVAAARQLRAISQGSGPSSSRIRAGPERDSRGRTKMENRYVGAAEPGKKSRSYALLLSSSARPVHGIVRAGASRRWAFRGLAKEEPEREDPDDDLDHDPPRPAAARGSVESDLRPFHASVLQSGADSPCSWGRAREQGECDRGGANRHGFRFRG